MFVFKARKPRHSEIQVILIQDTVPNVKPEKSLAAVIDGKMCAQRGMLIVKYICAIIKINTY